MKLLKSSLFLTLTSLVLLYSCDKIEEALSKDISVRNVGFEVITPIEDSESDTDRNSFSGEITVDYHDPQFATFKDYVSFIDKIKVDEVVIITTSTGNGTMAQNLNLVSSQAGVNLTIPSYEFGTEYSNAQRTTAAESILNAILNKKTVDLKVSGQTDETQGNNLTHQILIKSGTVTVKLL